MGLGVASVLVAVKLSASVYDVALVAVRPVKVAVPDRVIVVVPVPSNPLAVDWERICVLGVSLDVIELGGRGPDIIEPPLLFVGDEERDV